jgi:hypothetical protein
MSLGLDVTNQYIVSMYICRLVTTHYPCSLKDLQDISQLNSLKITGITLENTTLRICAIL